MEGKVNKRHLDEEADGGLPLKRSRPETVDNLSSHNASNHGTETKHDQDLYGDQADTPGLMSSRKRKSCFIDLDSEDFRAAKKICVKVPNGPTWRTPLAKLRDIFWKILTQFKELFHCEGSFTSLYQVGRKLGDGGFGVVYKGTRKKDGRIVALKYIRKEGYQKFLKFPGTSVTLPSEVAMHLLVSRPPISEHVVELLEWFDQPDKLILVMDYPAPCVDVLGYMENARRPLTENMARSIMKQVLQACQDLRECGVLHRDIKAENLLWQTDTRKVKLIDFGCADFLHDEPYTDFAGTPLFCPPEWIYDRKYDGRKANIWSIGVLLYNLVTFLLPFQTVDEITNKHTLSFRSGISKECKELICWCLRRNAEERPTLEEMLQGDWLSKGKQEYQSVLDVFPGEKWLLCYPS
ncbi:hypothetical protein UPYG_G00062090 [Umbra pygmaea]|uniref:non-specific serine/threonine protein kinase n=1 Tax=Umbra pygmaea TaxID=75934 RepID=A0ABD0XDC3_UMBPY